MGGVRILVHAPLREGYLMKGKERRVTQEDKGTWKAPPIKDSWVKRRLEQKSQLRSQKRDQRLKRQAPNRKPSKRSLFLIVPVSLTLLWGWFRSWLNAIYIGFISISLRRLRQVRERITEFRNRFRRFRKELFQKIFQVLLLPVMRAKAIGRWIFSPIRKGLEFVKRGAELIYKTLQELKREYDKLLTISDAKLDGVGKSVKDGLEGVRLSAEGLESRSGVQFRGSSAWIKKKRFLKRSKRWEFVVLRPEVFRELPDSEILFLLDQLHQRLTPFKQISLLEKTQTGIQRNADWCRSEFERTRADWEAYAPKATLDPDAWFEDSFEWLIKEIGHQHLAWSNWIVIPTKQIPDAFYSRLIEIVEEDDLYPDRVEYEKMLFKLFHPFCDSEPADMLEFEEYQRRLFTGERLWDVLAPVITSIEPWGIQTSSGAWMSTLQLHSLGSDVVSYTPEVEKGQVPKTFTETVVRDVDWLKQQLNQVLMMDSRRDQQIWLETAVVGVSNLSSFMSTLKRHLRTIYAWSEKQRKEHPKPVRKYAAAIRKFYDTADDNPTTTQGYQQSYSMMLKAGSWESLIALRDRVTRLLGIRGVFFEPAVIENQHWDGLRRMLPVIWESEVKEDYGIPRASMPMTMEELRTIFKVPQIDISPVGGIVGIFADGNPIVIGPGNFGILGTTEVGKSFALEEVLLMTGPLSIAETEIFVVDIIGRKPGSEEGGWTRSLVKLLGGEEIFPSLFDTPQQMRQFLDSQLDTLAFLYNPDEDLKDAVEFDMQFLKFVLSRMKATREEDIRQAPQATLPGFQGVSGFENGRPPRKKIVRRFFVLDELEAWLQDREDPRPKFLINRIMSQARKSDMSFLYSAKSMESAREVNPGVWSMLKNLTDKGWILFWTPDAESVPETITYPRNTLKSARKANLIVDHINDIRRMGGMTKVEQTYGQIVYATGDYIQRGRIIPPPPLVKPMKRKKGKGWGG